MQSAQTSENHGYRSNRIARYRQCRKSEDAPHAAVITCPCRIIVPWRKVLKCKTTSHI